eukprot:GCRY01001244.1.p1 GENE.GCRY01001244.1~~GCRY01001244.1.p1  ORF type:complete len:719 (+),score=155.95 GCRY01001244.1:237-2393(+)
MLRTFTKKQWTLIGIGSGVLVGGGLLGNMALSKSTREKYKLPPESARVLSLPSREQQIASLEKQHFDVLVVGGGATGSGVALDAATRGLSVALVERDDFSSGTSSRSTKLIHGGVRYLEQALTTFDFMKLQLVHEALHERKAVAELAPHLVRPVAMAMPIYHWWLAPYYFVGSKVYDLLAGSRNLVSSYFMGAKKLRREMPMINDKGIVGAVVVYDGQHNDSRMCVMTALTAAKANATVANHMEVCSLRKDEEGRVCGAVLRDALSGKVISVKAKVVVNATGPWVDSLRLMDDPKATPILKPSSGVHIILPRHFCPDKCGLIDPKTTDGRILYFLPWEGRTVAGTTDTPCAVEKLPMAQDEEVDFILTNMNRYLKEDCQLFPSDVESVWSGIRPLVSDPRAKNTAKLTRSHIVFSSESGLVTIAGGKFTTFRRMAQDTVDHILKSHKDLRQASKPCGTEKIRLIGSEGYTSTHAITLAREHALDMEVASHLSSTYGVLSGAVLESGRQVLKEPLKRLSSELPYLECEVAYACGEYAATATDVIARRTRIAFLNASAARRVAPRVVEIMGHVYGWGEDRCVRELKEVYAFVDTMQTKESAAKAHALSLSVRSPATHSLSSKSAQNNYKDLPRNPKEKTSSSDPTPSSTHHSPSPSPYPSPTPSATSHHLYRGDAESAGAPNTKNGSRKKEQTVGKENRNTQKNACSHMYRGDSEQPRAS